MRTRFRALTLDLVGERLELAGNVLLDRRLLDLPEELEPRRNAPDVVQPYPQRDRRERIAACEGSQAARNCARSKPVRRNLVDLESDMDGHLEQPKCRVPGLLNGDYCATTRDDMAEAQVRDEFDVAIVVGQHTPCGGGVGLQHRARP